MSGYTWNSYTIVDDLAEYDCLRALYFEEAQRVAERTGCPFTPDAALDVALANAAAQYHACLERHEGQVSISHDGVVAAVKALYLYLHAAFVNPSFDTVPTTATDHLALRLIKISPRGLVAHNFCYRFLVLVGWFHFGIPMLDEDDFEEFDALIEASVRNFETNPGYSFDQMRTRAFRHRSP